MANFMGPMAPPQAAPPQPQKLDIRTSPGQRQQIQDFMRQRTAMMPMTSAPVAPPPMMPMMPQMPPQMPLRMEMGGDVDIDAEAERLGDNSEARIEAASLFANKFFPEEALPAIERMCESADGIIALETIMEAIKDPSVTEQTNISSNFNEIELQEMQRDERYWNPAKRDNNFVNQVNEGYKKLYG